MMITRLYTFIETLGCPSLKIFLMALINHYQMTKGEIMEKNNQNDLTNDSLEIRTDIIQDNKNAYREEFLAQLKNDLDALARGDLSFNPVLKEYDQYTRDLHEQYVPINASLIKARDAIKKMATDANLLSTAAVEGKLSARIDTSNHQGDYQKVVQGVNDTLDAIIGPLKISASCFEKISKGEIPSKIDKELKGDFDVIKNDLNACIDGLGGLVEADDVLKRMAVNDLTKSMEGKYSGVFADVARSVNVVESNINHIRLIVQNVSKGDLCDLAAIKEIGHRSEADEIVPSFIVLMESLEALVMDANKVAKAVMDGQMHVRADVNKHQGKFKDVIKGVNDTIDAVDQPLLETMRIADAYAGGDLTARVSIETKGDFVKFGQALDKIGENLTDLLRQVNESANIVSSTSQELASSAEEMNASTEQVSSAIQQISKGAQNQAAQVEETAKTMETVTKTVEATQTRSIKAGEDARATSQRANAGVMTVENTIKKMQEIQKVVVESAKVIESLGKRSEEIGEIVDVITNISDQTNLLALNAAIEAARAGEQGRGFAVVAEEVKNLAEDSREAAERIAKMIKEVQVETGKAVEAMQRGTKETAEGMEHVEVTGKAFKEISQMASSFEETMSAFQVEMRVQKEGAAKASKAVDSIASVAEETASASEESAASTEELTASMEDMTARAQALSEMAVNLQKMAAQFNIESSEPVPSAMPSTQAPKVQSSPALVKKSTQKGNIPGVPTKVKEALGKRGIATASE
jgi:methyl-accepting chemotaxis protein